MNEFPIQSVPMGQEVDYLPWIFMGATFVGCFVAFPILMGILRMLGLYVVVRERQCAVFELFGKVRLVIDKPGIFCPWISMGPLAALVLFFGKKHIVDLRLNQI